MNENTTKGEKMIEMTYCGKLIHGPGSVGWICCEGNRACPSCLRAHISRLEAALAEAKAGRVVPELTEDILLQIYRDCKQDLIEAGGRPSLWAAKRISEWFRFRLSTTPASRVLRDGEERIGAEELVALRCINDAV